MNHNQYVCASGKTPYRNPKSIIIGRQEPRKSENRKLKRFEREEKHAEVGNIDKVETDVNMNVNMEKSRRGRR